jgi:hypothetical protein
MTLLSGIGKWWSETLGSGGAVPTDLQKITNQTELVTRRLFVIGTAVLVALILAGLSRNGGITFVIWALVGALAAATIGGALGVLFGLPTPDVKREVIIANQAVAAQNAGHAGGSSTSPLDAPASAAGRTDGEIGPGPVQEDIDTGYRDSTSLEQIADWLTKIIVGLTLTQFASWEDRYSNLASNLTEAMIGVGPFCGRATAGLTGDDLRRVLDLPVCQASAVPGGIIIAFFATTGFLIAYLWMRRYFILELVIAKKQAKDLLTAKSAQILARVEAQRREAETSMKVQEEHKAIEAARSASLAEESPSRPLIVDAQLETILDNAEQRLSPGSPGHKTLLNIRKKVKNDMTDPDDPWRGKFGEVSANNVRLEASVTPLVDNPQFFKVDVNVRSEIGARSAELQGTKVLYFLHPTFGNQPRLSTFRLDGTAPLELFAYGAFTAGALLEDGTALELNLATVQGAPAQFVAQ